MLLIGLKQRSCSARDEMRSIWIVNNGGGNNNRATLYVGKKSVYTKEGS